MPDIRIPYHTLLTAFTTILEREGMHPQPAALCAQLFADASRDGVNSHGINRFPGFVRAIRNGAVLPNESPALLAAFNGLERYDGRLGPGPANAAFAISRACDLAADHGIAAVALANTNHWMRAGSYGWMAAARGCLAILWTNGSPIMPPHGASVAKLGNNPMVLAVPRDNGRHVVLDMAMSQYAWGKLKIWERAGQLAPIPAGYTPDGKLSDDPRQILHGGTALPIGYWKGASLSLLLDLFASLLSGGNASRQLHHPPYDHGISQLFIAIDPRPLQTNFAPIVEAILADLHDTPPIDAENAIVYPGERVFAARTRSMRDGVLVEDAIWREVQSL